MSSIVFRLKSLDTCWPANVLSQPWNELILFPNWGKIQETSFKGLDYGNRYFQSNEEAFGGLAGFVLQITLASLEILSCHRFFLYNCTVSTGFLFDHSMIFVCYLLGRFSVGFLMLYIFLLGRFSQQKQYSQGLYIQTIEADWGHIMVRDWTLAMMCLLSWGRFLYQM